MKKLILTIIVMLLLTFIFSCQKEEISPAKNVLVNYKHANENHLSNIEKLTHGGENAEAYPSFNGEMLIYQATTGEMQCDQIFIMNMDGTKNRLVSTGFGRTTCAYFLPGDKSIIYASTHHYDKSCPPKPDMSRGYVWKLYDNFDIFSSKADASELKQLTDTGKYDAEATLSPLGDKIVFTSTRDGDPEIYVMNIDGSNQKRLTYKKGYDGGPFFSPDGKIIVFRASRPRSDEELKDYTDLVENGLVRPSNLEIYVMNSDGSDMKQITDLGVASFAPFFHPDGKRIIFSTNYGSASGREFNIYMINSDNYKLEQITYTEGFDGFPIFSKDGKKLIFASNRQNENPGATNIFVADWIE